MDINSKLNDVLDIEDAEYDDLTEDDALPPPVTLPPAVREGSTEITVTTTPDERKDYEKARKSFKDLLEAGHTSLEGMAALAAQSDSPRAYEVVAKMIDSLGALTEKMYGIHQKVKDTGILNDLQQQQGSINVDKAVFIGTSADMLNKLKEDKEI